MLLIKLVLLLLFYFKSCLATITILDTNTSLVDRISAFGPRIDKAITGTVILSENKYGCSPLINISQNHTIVLVERGQCSFLQKVLMMQQSGASAVIVGDRFFNGWITLYAPGDTSFIHIPSVFVARHQFQILLDLIQTKQDARIKMTGDDLLSSPLLDMLLVVVLSPAIMMLFVYLTWKLRQRQKRNNEIAPGHFVQKLPSYVFGREKKSDHCECAICLEDYLQGEILRTLPCKHEFHAACIDAWLTSHKKFCPICKFDICSRKKSVNERSPLLRG